MDPSNLTPAIFADGPGTLAPVAGRPFVTYLLDQLISAGFRSASLLAGRRSDETARELGDAYGTLKLTYERDRIPKFGSGGAIVMSGDSYLDFDLRSLLRFHADRDRAASLALARSEEAGRLGTVGLGMGDQVIEFAEERHGRAGWVNAGVYVLDRRVIESIPPDAPMSLEQIILPRWVARGKVFGMRCLGRFLDLGTPESRARAGGFFLDPGELSHAG